MKGRVGPSRILYVLLSTLIAGGSVDGRAGLRTVEYAKGRRRAAGTGTPDQRAEGQARRGRVAAEDEGEVGDAGTREQDCQSRRTARERSKVCTTLSILIHYSFDSQLNIYLVSVQFYSPCWLVQVTLKVVRISCWLITNQFDIYVNSAAARCRMAKMPEETFYIQKLVICFVSTMLISLTFRRLDRRCKNMSLMLPYKV